MLDKGKTAGKNIVGKGKKIIGRVADKARGVKKTLAKGKKLGKKLGKGKSG